MNTDSKGGTKDREILVPATLWKDIYEFGNNTNLNPEQTNEWAAKAYELFKRIDHLTNFPNTAVIAARDATIAELRSQIKNAEKIYTNLQN